MRTDEPAQPQAFDGKRFQGKRFQGKRFQGKRFQGDGFQGDGSKDDSTQDGTAHPADLDALPFVEATLVYAAASAEKLRTYTFAPPPGHAWTNVVAEPHSVVIRDMRPIGAALDLDRHGFELLRHVSAVGDFWNEDAVRSLYYREAETLLKAATGADRVHVFDHTLRRRVPGAEDVRGEGPRQPANRVHVDQTVKSGPERVRFELPDEAEALLRGRVEIINLWRPLKGPLYDAPLALCDATSVAARDLVAADLVFPARTGEIYLLNFDPAQRWFYVRGMEANEVLLLKCYDSATDGRARFAPHGSFLDPTAPKDTPLRESIEVRAMVFHRA